MTRQQLENPLAMHKSFTWTFSHDVNVYACVVVYILVMFHVVGIYLICKLRLMSHEMQENYQIMFQTFYKHQFQLLENIVHKNELSIMFTTKLG